MLVSSCRSNDKATTMLMSNDKKQKMCRMCGRGRSGTRCADVRTHVSYVTVLPSSEPALSFFIKPPGPATFVRISGTHRPATATLACFVPLLIGQEARSRSHVVTLLGTGGILVRVSFSAHLVPYFSGRLIQHDRERTSHIKCKTESALAYNSLDYETPA